MHGEIILMNLVQIKGIRDIENNECTESETLGQTDMVAKHPQKVRGSQKLDRWTVTTPESKRMTRKEKNNKFDSSTGTRTL